MQVVCISDLHLSRWLRHSPEPDFRMTKQPLELAKRLVSVMKERQTNYLFILGDLIDAWNEEPAVVEVLCKFYQTIIKAIPSVYIGFIEGQHDLCIRDRYSSDNSFIHLVAALFPNNVHYLHDKYLTIGETSLYFSSYHREKPILPEKHVNIFCSHITLGMTEFKQDKFDLCVAGDIHAIYDSGKCHSCCTPYQLYAHEEPLGRIGIITLDGSKSKFERILSDSDNFEFMKIEATQKRIFCEKTGQKELVFDHTELHKMIAEEVHKANLDAIHNLIPQKEAPQPINFQFKFKKLIIDNVRSIDHLELNLEDFKGITYVKGATGAGKSSIFYSLITALCGASKSELEGKSNRITQKPLKLQLWLEYEGKEFYILRSIKETKFAINGKDITGGKKETQTKIEENLPFIPYWKYFFLKASQHYFESLDKTELLSILFNLNIFNYLYAQGKLLLKNFNKSLKDSQHELAISEGTNKALTEELMQTRSQANDIFAKLPANHLQLEEDYKKLASLLKQHTSLKSLNAHLTNENADFRRKLENFEESHQLDKKTILGALEALESEKEKVSKEKVLLNTLLQQKELLEDHIRNIKNNHIICPNCGYSFSKDNITSTKELEDQLEDVNNKLSNINTSTDIDDLNNQIKQKRLLLLKIEAIESNRRSLDINNARLIENNKEISIIEDKIYNIYNIYFSLVTFSLDASGRFMEIYNAYKSQKAQLQLLQSKIKELEERIANNELLLSDLSQKCSNLELQVSETERYISIFDISNLSSAPYSILKKLTTYLNTDNIRFTASTDNDKFAISVAIKIGDQWIDYADASDGQKNFLDMFILIRITAFLNGVGFIVMDEPFSNMDQQYIASANSLLSDICADTIFVSSHTTINAYDRIMSVTQNSSGISQIEL